MTSLMNNRTYIPDPTMKVEAPIQILSALAQVYDSLSRTREALYDLMPKVTDSAQSCLATVVPSTVIGFARQNATLAEEIESLVRQIAEAIGDAPITGVSEEVGFNPLKLADLQDSFDPSVPASPQYLIDRAARRFAVDPKQIALVAVEAKTIAVGDVIVYHDEPVRVDVFYTYASNVENSGYVSCSLDIGATLTLLPHQMVQKFLGLDRVINESLADDLS